MRLLLRSAARLLRESSCSTPAWNASATCGARRLALLHTKFAPSSDHNIEALVEEIEIGPGLDFPGREPDYRIHPFSLTGQTA